MKGIRFYEEYASAKAKRRRESEGNCVAVLIDARAGGMYDAIVAPFYHPNCPPCLSSVAIDYLRLRCRRVSESRAREVHPALFRYLAQ